MGESCSVVSNSLQPHGLYSPWNSWGQNTGLCSFPFSRGSSQPRDQTQVFCIAGGFFTSWVTREAHIHTTTYKIDKQQAILQRAWRAPLSIKPCSWLHQTNPDYLGQSVNWLWILFTSTTYFHINTWISVWLNNGVGHNWSNLAVAVAAVLWSSQVESSIDHLLTFSLYFFIEVKST